MTTTKISKMQQKELDEIEEILPTLWREGLLTDVDCRIIASSAKLMEKKGAVYAVIMAKTKEEAAILTEAFRNMTAAIQAKESLNDACSNEENNYSILPSRNPFLNNTIINRLLGFLPLDDLKRCRLVCREWCSTAEVCLRKRSAIKFDPNDLLPRTFMGVSKYSHPDLPFHSFIFSTAIDSRLRIDWPISEMEDFFEKWGKKIKEVTFDYITLARKCNLTDEEVLIPKYDVTPLFINPTNITSLIIRHPIFLDQTTNFEISLEKFVSIKTLYLSDCRIIASTENQSSRIAPLNIFFQNVSFKQNGQILQNFYYNDIIDFSKAFNIHLEQLSIDDAKFDMGKQVFNLNQLHLVKVSLKNWAQAKGKVQFLSLSDIPFEEKNNLNIKQLKFADSKIDLTALPKSLEFLHLLNSSIEIICTEPFLLPNLKYLYIDVKYSNSLQYFSNCTNLKELEIRNSGPGFVPCPFSVSCIPNSVDTLRMERSQIQFTDNCIFELDSLILENINVLSTIAITAQIKAKALVVDLNSQTEIDSLDIVKLVQTNKQSQKILIDASDSDLHENTPFEGSELSNCVDNKSYVYEFYNGFGKSITEEEFQRCFTGEDYFPPHFNFKAMFMSMQMQMQLLVS